MEATNYWWYSKTIFLSVVIVSMLSIFLRRKGGSSIPITLALGAIFLIMCSVADFILGVHYDYHPLMLCSGSSFGWLFVGFILLSFGYLYYMRLLRAVRPTWQIILRLNIPLIISIISYASLSWSACEPLRQVNLNELLRLSLNQNPFAILWLLTALTLILYTLYVSVRIVTWTADLLSAAHDVSLHHNLRHYTILITIILLDLSIFLGILSFLFIHDRATESACFLTLSLLYMLSVLLASTLPIPPQHRHPTCKRSRETGESIETAEIPHITRSRDQFLVNTLKHMMHEDEIFRHKDLNTKNLSESLRISRKKLYSIISECFHTSFPEYVNNYRLEYAARLMDTKDSLNLTTAQIADLSGFQSLKTFNRLFKAKYAITPTQYRNTTPIL